MEKNAEGKPYRGGKDKSNKQCLTRRHNGLAENTQSVAISGC